MCLTHMLYPMIVITTMSLLFRAHQCRTTKNVNIAIYASVSETKSQHKQNAVASLLAVAVQFDLLFELMIITAYTHTRTNPHAPDTHIYTCAYRCMYICGCTHTHNLACACTRKCACMRTVLHACA